VPQIYTDDGLLVHSFQSLLADLADLQRCLTEWTQRRIDPFPLGAHDSSDSLTIPEQLCGREREIGRARARIRISGIGKSSVVNELHRELVPPTLSNS
jgi:hypothetical protein